MKRTLIFSLVCWCGACTATSFNEAENGVANPRAPIPQTPAATPVFDSAFDPNAASNAPAKAQASEATVTYTCPMHPEIVRSEPGNCPICGMKLVPKSSGDKH